MRQTYTYPDKLNLVSVLGATINNLPANPSVQNLSNYYVSGTSGSDANGTGAIFSPWKTISKAINVLNAISGDITATINIAAGTYTENLLIEKSGISLIGASSLPNVTVLTGNVNFSMAANSFPTPFSIGGFQNIQLNGNLTHYQSHGSKNSLNVSNCLFVPPNGFNAVTTGLIGIGSGLSDMTVRDCMIYMCNNTVAVAINNTTINMYNTQLTNNPSSIGKTSFIAVGGSGQINLYGCSITQVFAGFNVDSLIFVNNTTTVVSGSTINNCMLVYTSLTSSINKACIMFSGSVNMNTYTVINNYFQCEGAPSTLCIQVIGPPQLNLVIGQNIASGTAFTVPPSSGTYIKTSLNSVT